VRAWLAAAVVVGGGCGASLPGTDLPPSREVRPALEFPELRDYRGIVDCRPSATGVDQARLGDLAQAAQIDFICLADRVSRPTSNYGTPGFTSQVLFFPGGSFAANGGEILGIDLHDPIDPALDAPKLIEEIHRQGGVAIANQVERFSSASDYALADGIAIFSLSQAWEAAGRWRVFVRALLLGPDRLFGALDVRPLEGLRLYDEMARGTRVSMVAAMGAEKNLGVFGSRVGTFEQLMLISTTHLLASEREPAPMLDALKRGHAYVSFDFLGYVPQFAFYAVDGEHKTMMGNEVAFTPTVTLKVRLPSLADEIAIVAGGAPVAQGSSSDQLESKPKGPGVYRAEAYRGGHPWILSNPVYLR
jgi:hypothetical protein